MTRRWLIAGGLLACLGVLTVGLPVVLLVSAAGSGSAAEAASCLSGSASAYTLDVATLTPIQASNADTIISVGSAMVGQQGDVIALAAALVESDLVNLPNGDRDSAGLFQMRPSQGWGTHAQVTDPTYASEKFYLALLSIPDWQQLPPGDAAQAVERSAFGDRYASRVGEAQAIVAAAAPGTTPPSCLSSVPSGGLPAAAVAAIDQAPLQVQVAIAYAVDQLGKPYEWGGTGPNAYDCSGLTERAYEAAGIEITRTTFTQVDQGQGVTGGPYLPGDLIFPDGGHVQLYIGGGYVIEAPHTGDVVRVDPIGAAWQARRIVSVG